MFRYKRNGRDRWMGIGSFPTVALADARERAAESRRKLSDGVDPIEERREQQAAKKLKAIRGQTFQQCATAYIAAHNPAWHNSKHAAQWQSTLAAYAYPAFGSLPVASIDTALVLQVLEPIWSSKPETASRVRGRIERILDWAKARGYREGENPARWRGHLDHLLPAKNRVARVEHHAALPYAQLPGFIASLREQASTGARALEFLILTAARTGEIIGATWGEIDFGEKVWTIPPSRMKAGKEHRVPLSTRAIEILKPLQPALAAPEGHVFRGNKPGKPLSNMAFLMLLRRMGRGDLTAHGFRSTFRDWCAERTSFPAEVAEMALAHSISSKVEAAYRRGDLFEKRRRLTELWSEYCGGHLTHNVAVMPLRGVANE
jgi:integrase